MTAVDERRDQFRRVVEAAGDGVVRIGRHGGRGCGFVYDEGVVVTNAHNLRDRTTEVTFADGRAVQARALGIDVDGDLAVLEVDTGGQRPLAWTADGGSDGAGGTAAEAESRGDAEADADDEADSETGQLGDAVFAVVRTGDGLRVTAGAVSALGRSFRGPRGRRITDAVEHTAPLARGSSGSPIVDGAGRLVGITTLRLGEGFFLALPATAALRQRVEELRAGRAPQRRVLGVGLAPVHVARRLRRAVGLPERAGVLVRGVQEGSPADRGGIRAGDLITAVGDVDEVASPDDVAAALDRIPEGESLRLHVVRGTDELDLAVPLDAPAPDDPGEA
jgi:S1-C subfamily serine protease